MTSISPFAINAEQLSERFDKLPGLVVAEVAGLDRRHLDWESGRWEWSKWGIRRQLSHMTSVAYGWLCGRWGAVLFPEGPPAAYRDLASMGHDDRVAYYMGLDVPALLANLEQSIGLARQVLERETPQTLRDRRITVQIRTSWDFMARAHPTGITQDAADPTRWHFTLEATLRHVYFENITHLYNIQRLKRVQGLAARVKAPFEGYWALPGWDRSEPA